VRHIVEHGVQEGIDLSVEILPSPYVSQALFEKYVYAVRILAVESNCGLLGCEKKPAFLFCGNRAAHCLDDVLTKLALHGVIVITYPSDTSHISKYWMFFCSEF
jgi:hypothetical protein